MAIRSVWTELPGLGRISPQDLGPGRFAFRELPSGTVVFQCRLGGSLYRLAHDTNVPTAVLEVPRPGGLVLLPPKGWQDLDGSHDYVDVTPIDLDGERFRASFFVPGERERPELLPPGRYRVQAMRLHLANDDQPARRVPLGVAVEVAIRPGETARVQLQ